MAKRWLAHFSESTIDHLDDEGVADVDYFIFETVDLDELRDLELTVVLGEIADKALIAF